MVCGALFKFLRSPFQENPQESASIAAGFLEALFPSLGGAATPVARAIFMSGPPPSMPSRVAPLGTVPRQAYPGQADLILQYGYSQIWNFGIG